MKEFVTLIKHKEFAKAKRLLKKALQTEPDNVYLLTQMAGVLWNLGKDEEALTFAMKAKEIDSDYPLMLFTLGRTCPPDLQTSALGDGTLYVLGMTTVNDEQHFGFHRYTGSEMAAHKAFVLVDSQQALARSLTMVFDEATGIESAEADSSLFTRHSSLSSWFTLDGRRLQAKPTAPGIYINKSVTTKLFKALRQSACTYMHT